MEGTQLNSACTYHSQDFSHPGIFGICLSIVKTCVPQTCLFLPQTFSSVFINAPLHWIPLSCGALEGSVGEIRGGFIPWLSLTHFNQTFSERQESYYKTSTSNEQLSVFLAHVYISSIMNSHQNNQLEQASSSTTFLRVPRGQSF